ncbi:MAG: hypothetical protein JWL90_3662 [Chthoniobacteraceae bacterium]|nr:hypothetical protein [Chthoniobacteraceae bacterium]
MNVNRAFRDDSEEQRLTFPPGQSERGRGSIEDGERSKERLVLGCDLRTRWRSALRARHISSISYRSIYSEIYSMKNTVRIVIICLAAGSLAIAATTKSQPLTPKRIAELTAPSDVPPPRAYKVMVSSLQRPFPGDNGPISVILPAGKPQAVLECIRELRFPSAFTPPKRVANREPGFDPTLPTEFDTVNTGWTIRFSAKQHGKVIALAGVADYVEGEMPKMGNGGYGPLGAPIYDEAGKLLSPNVLHQPRIQTTTTRFQIFALPGETYEVTLYRGDKAEKHSITVTTQ